MASQFALKGRELGLISPSYLVWEAVQANIYFLDFLLRTPQLLNEYLRVASGVVQRRRAVRKDVFLNIKIPLPPLSEQDAIVKALQTVQDAIQARYNELELEQERKDALVRHLFTHGTQGELTRQSDIGEIPGSWQVVQLADLLREPLKNGHSARESNGKEGVRTLTLTAVTQNDFSHRNTKFTIAEPHKVRNLWLRPGDIFIERANSHEFVGLAALYKGPEDFAIYPDLLIRVRLNEDTMYPRFAVEFLLSNFCRNYFRKNATGTAGNMPKIDQGTVLRTFMPLPSLPEQHRIADILSICDDKINSLEQEILLEEELFRALLEELMTGRLLTLPLIEEGGNHE